MSCQLDKMVDCCKAAGISPVLAYSNNCLYYDLCEVLKYWDVTWGCQEKILHCRARRRPDEPLSIFIPISSNTATSLEEVERLQGIFNTDVVILAIQDPDSSSVYYECSKGLVRNVPEKAKKEYPDSFIRNNKKLLLAQAQGGKEWTGEPQ